MESDLSPPKMERNIIGRLAHRAFWKTEGKSSERGLRTRAGLDLIFSHAPKSRTGRHSAGSWYIEAAHGHIESSSDDIGRKRGRTTAWTFSVHRVSAPDSLRVTGEQSRHTDRVIELLDGKRGLEEDDGTIAKTIFAPLRGLRNNALGAKD